MVTAAAIPGFRDMRAGVATRSGTYAFEVGDEVVTGWHHHDLHQLEYAFAGTAEVQTAQARYLLPPQQAVWIPAGVEHCTTLTRVRTVAVFFDPALDIPAGDDVRVLAVPPVLREMVLYARRWPIDHPRTDEPMADAFLEVLARLVLESVGDPALLRLPTSRDPLVAAAIRVTDQRLAGVSLREVCAAVGTSERTLRRAFPAEIGLTWQEYLRQARLLRATALLAQPSPNVLAVGTAVGFASPSGFTRAFRRYTGETPYAYHRRVTGSAHSPR